MEQALLDKIRNLSDGAIRRLTNLQTKEDIDILRTAIFQRAQKWIEAGVLDADSPWQEAWNLFKTCLEIRKVADMRQEGSQDKKKLPLGRIVATPGALKALQDANQEPAEFLSRHETGDWGELCEEDKKENESSLSNGSRLLSAYKTHKGKTIWIITEADRSTTTILLPNDY